MPVVISDSGQLTPTDPEHRAILEQAKISRISLINTEQFPAIIVSNPISPLPLPATPNWQPCERQYLRHDMLERTSFGNPRNPRSLTDAPRRAWMLFLEEAGVSMQGYDEGSGAYPGFNHYPGLYRHHLANDLLKSGKLQLLTDGHGYLIAPAPKKATHALTCSDLAGQGRWSSSLCCAQCHSEGTVFEEVLEFIDNPLTGRRVRREAMICCHAAQYIHDWHEDLHLTQSKQMCAIDDIDAN